MACLSGTLCVQETAYAHCVNVCNVGYARIPHSPKGTCGVFLFRAVGRLCRMFAGLGPARSVALGRTTVLIGEGNVGPKWPKVGSVGRSSSAAIEGAASWCCSAAVGFGKHLRGSGDSVSPPCGVSVCELLSVVSCHHLDL